MADIFISYTSADRDWAFWIGHELEDLGHVPHVHDWEVSGGENIMAWMEQRHDAADHVLCVVSASYLGAAYSDLERQAAQWAAAKGRSRFALPVFIEPCEAPTLFASLKRCDLHGIDEAEAREKLKAFLEPAKKPPRGTFPGGKRPSVTPVPPAPAPSFPGRRKRRNLPFGSIGDLFKGRDATLDQVHEALAKSGDGRAVALYGLGGVGKTRLAVEYALAHEAEHAALLFVSAESPTQLDSGLAALAGQDSLELPEKDASDDKIKIDAVIRWLADNPGWLLILDNVDDEQAAAAVEARVGQLAGGEVLVTGRAWDFSPSIEAISIDVLKEEDAARFLIERTKKRETSPNDEALAHELARELGGLALALAQAGAYIDKQRTSIARYLKLWRETREKLLQWFKPRLVGTHRDKSLATTWVTSVEKLTPEGRRLLELCAFLDPAPIPKFFLDVPLPASFETAPSGPPQDEGTNPNGPHPEEVRSTVSKDEEIAKPPSRSTRATPTSFDAHEALADLYAFSLASPAEVSDGKTTTAGFTIHRLVQDFTRSGMTDERQRVALQDALGWVNAAFVGHPSDVRTWPCLDPLAPHALAVAQCGDNAGIGEPSGQLYAKLGVLYSAKARHTEEERLKRRAVVLGEEYIGPDHPEVAVRLNNLAELLRITNRLAEAEPLMRRALTIDEASYGPDHPEVATDLNNLASLLQVTNRLAEAEPLMRRTLAIVEVSYGPDHPKVSVCLNNLALLLEDTNRLAEAEPLMRRALAILANSYDPDHPHTMMARANLARMTPQAK